MSSALKNRLVGTIIIVALAVIFLPDILDGKKQTNQEQFVSLPEQPLTAAIIDAPEFPVEQVKQEVDSKPEIVPDVAEDDFDMSESTPAQTNKVTEDQQQTASPIESHSVASEKAQQVDRQVSDPAITESRSSTLDESLLEEAGWVVQLGVFRHQKNVRELLTKLRKAGYRAFSRPVKTSSGELTKVFVGPDLEKESLQKAIPHLREITKLQGRITPFTVK
ncbi:SPOR domain-containing protein [Aliiglaciecola litoralis]|uniref:SPOR domain-containing protein n=1 Tax=Aliiglaciecola litoralis TaxID=582857 RepID=UPI0031D1E817